ncbi:hypothetical protein J1605_003493 [Eschrichtius robustus]|uniref:Myosin phosphatase Rho-interacting protein n=1 Tax=Eschrichtius robustus TaxID=9764 RepID=A0AB34HLD1_ESCRO|nr:hypothetical protein J1605_003493 [Eschrichtius robustus]
MGGSHLAGAKPIYGGWLLLAPDGTDFDNPVHRSRKWQRRFFILYEHGLLRYALDEMAPSSRWRRPCRGGCVLLLRLLLRRLEVLKPVWQLVAAALTAPTFASRHLQWPRHTLVRELLLHGWDREPWATPGRAFRSPHDLPVLCCSGGGGTCQPWRRRKPGKTGAAERVFGVPRVEGWAQVTLADPRGDEETDRCCSVARTAVQEHGPPGVKGHHLCA